MASHGKLNFNKIVGILFALVGLYGLIDWALTPAQKLPWRLDEKAAFLEAAENNKGVMLDISATWCAPCQELEANTFSDPEVYKAITEKYIPLKLDVSDGNLEDDNITKHYNAKTLPAVLFLTADGKELGRVDDYIPAEDFLTSMKNAESLSENNIGVDKFTKALNKGWIWAYLLAFTFGFLTSLTPCVYPMIPITVAVFGAREQSASKSKAFLLATAYIFGMGLLYAVLGTIFALAGGRSGTLLANPFVVIPISIIMTVFAISLFGAFDLALPASLQNRLNQVGGKGYKGAFAMGLVGGFIAAPCTGPFLAGMLGFVATTGNWLAGSTLLFTYAMGVGVLFWVIALTSMALPKSGNWMDAIKSIGGLALLVVALYFLRPIAPKLVGLMERSPMYLIASLALILAGMILGAIHQPLKR